MSTSHARQGLGAPNRSPSCRERGAPAASRERPGGAGGLQGEQAVGQQLGAQASPEVVPREFQVEAKQLPRDGFLNARHVDGDRGRIGKDDGDVHRSGQPAEKHERRAHLPQVHHKILEAAPTISARML